MQRVPSAPPSYSQELQSTSLQDEQTPPSYGDVAPTGPTTSPYRPFPDVMNGCYYMTGIKSLFLCGASRKERLFLVEIHTGLSGKGPLGVRRGLYLHNGTSNKDAIIAAAGDNSVFAGRAYTFNTATVVYLPLLEPRASTHSMDTETMRAGLAGDEVVFRFSIEVGEKQQRERFEWRKIQKGGGDAIKSGGFRLAQVSNRHKGTSTSRDVASSSAREGPLCPQTETATDNAEVLALLSWPTGLSKLTNGFSLQLQGRAKSMGNRWSLMVVITALRLWELHVQSRTSKTGIAIEGKLRGPSGDAEI
ncbi:hypothetical protein LZ32DRAFT_607870 [Colletotrichum eremochloae]|nr:hypothetical protein LZ32DRAFT_607870 [Colletotrichum eremochloae]